MPRLLGALLCACLLACGLGQAAHAAPGLYVYKGNGPDGRKALPAFETFMGRKVDGVVDFLDQSSKAASLSDLSYTLGGWKGSGYKLSLSVPLTFSGTSLAQVGTGALDDYFKAVATQAVAAGFADADMRIGWEGNEGNYKWAAAPNPAAYIAAFQRAVTVMRTVPGQHFRYVWCVALGWQQVQANQMYPGDAYVDVVAYDIYPQGWNAQDKAEPGLTNDLLTESWGINGIPKFHPNKPVAITEYGVSGTRSDGHGAPGNGDDPTWAAASLKAFASWPNLLYVGVWDYHAGDFNGLISGGTFPKAAPILRAAFPAPVAPVAAAALKASFTCSVTDGGSCSVTPNPDGSATMTMTFPVTAAMHHYTVYLSAKRQVSTWGEEAQLGWDTKGGTATEHVGAT